MRSVAIAVLAFALGCGGHSMGMGDDGGLGDDGNGPEDDANGGPVNVLLTLNHRPTNAAAFTFLVAYRDGAADWQLAPAPLGDVYTLPINAPIYSVAWTCIGAAAAGNGQQQRQVVTASFSVNERTSLAFDVPPRCSDANGGGVSLHGTIANHDQGYVIHWGDRTTTANGLGQWAMTVPPGTHDLVIEHVGFVTIGGDVIADWAYVQRDLAVTGPTTADVDDQDSEYVQSFVVKLPAGTGRSVAATTLYTANGTSGAFVADGQQPWETESLADTQMRASDVYEQSMSISVGTQIQTATNATATPGAQMWSSLAPLGAVSGVVASDPYPRITTTWSAYGNAIGYGLSATQTPMFGGCGLTPCQISWITALSPGVVGQMPSYTLPDLSGLAGWSEAFQLVSGEQVSGTVVAQTSTAGASDFPPPTPPAGGTQRTFARSDYTVTP